MIQRHHWFTENNLPERLDQLLQTLWTPSEPRLSRSKIRKLILAGGVRVNGHVTRTCGRLIGKQIDIKVSFREDTLFKPHTTPAPLIPILYEDESLVIVNKPPGIPTQPTVDPLRHNVFQLLQAQIKPYLGLHHRLDRDTSGVLLCTKNKSVNRSIADQFKTRSIQKTYLAVVACSGFKAQSIQKTRTITTRLKACRIRGVQTMIPVEKGGQDAKTHIELLATHQSYALIRAKPYTGRMHQIRAHLSSIGCPIVGDKSYGSKMTASRVLLHASSLALKHPRTNAPFFIASARGFFARLTKSVPFRSIYKMTGDVYAWRFFCFSLSSNIYSLCDRAL
jgi:RluA family pseudouridine synthase